MEGETPAQRLSGGQACEERVRDALLTSLPGLTSAEGALGCPHKGRGGAGVAESSPVLLGVSGRSSTPPASQERPTRERSAACPRA